MFTAQLLGAYAMDDPSIKVPDAVVQEWSFTVRNRPRFKVSLLAANRFADDPLLYTTPYCHV